jgi:hypothetical protein
VDGGPRNSGRCVQAEAGGKAGGCARGDGTVRAASPPPPPPGCCRAVGAMLCVVQLAHDEGSKISIAQPDGDAAHRTAAHLFQWRRHGRAASWLRRRPGPGTLERESGCSQRIARMGTQRLRWAAWWGGLSAPQRDGQRRRRRCGRPLAAAALRLFSQASAPAGAPQAVTRDSRRRNAPRVTHTAHRAL